MPSFRRIPLFAATAVLAGGALWWRRHPSACPYSQRFWVQAPHPFITRARLREALQPRPGERVLEVGPGTGYYTLAVAEWLGPRGRLDILDVQPAMLAHTLRRAHHRGLNNIAAEQADARGLPYPDHSFDAAYLVAVLGEISDAAAALCELRRVLKPEGRLIIGELLGDPHWVSPRQLRRLADTTGLRTQGRVGTGIGGFTILRSAPHGSERAAPPKVTSRAITRPGA